MKKLIKYISTFFAILTLIFGLLLVPSIQDYAYSKSMSLLTKECTVVTTTTGWNALGTCWGNSSICRSETVTGPCDVVLEQAE